MVDDGKSGNWNQWSRHVLHELERLNEKMDAIGDRMEELGKDVAVLKFKAGVWGVLGGAIVAALGIGTILIKELL